MSNRTDKVLNDLKHLGFNSSTHWLDTSKVWVCPFYMNLKEVEQFIEYCNDKGLNRNTIKVRTIKDFKEHRTRYDESVKTFSNFSR